MSRFLQYGWVLFLIVLCNHHCDAQKKINGCITDQNTGKAVPYVIVQEVDGTRGEVSDDAGCFTISVDQLPVTLSFQLLGYETKTILFLDEKTNTIQLEPSNVLLNEMTISASGAHRLAGNVKRSIWDYCWFDGQILLCEYGYTLSDSRVILMSEEGDTLAIAETPDRPTGMFNDCTGAAYLVSRDSLWQCYREGKSLRFFPTESAELVDKVLKYCVGQNEQSIYFAIPAGKEFRIGDDNMAFNYPTNNDRMNYYIFDRQSEKLQLIKSVADEFTIALKNDEVAYGNGPQPSLRTSSPYSVAASKLFFYTIMCREIDAPMFYIDDSLYIFNYVSGYIEKMDSQGIGTGKTEVKYHLDKDYNRLTILDEEKKNIYLLYESKGMVTLHLLDLQNCVSQLSISIPHIFPEHITVAGNYIYYLCRDERVKEARVLNKLKIK